MRDAFAIGRSISLRRRQKHKAWGPQAPGGKSIFTTEPAKRTKGKEPGAVATGCQTQHEWSHPLATARGSVPEPLPPVFTGFGHYCCLVFGTYAPGFMLSPVPQARLNDDPRHAQRNRDTRRMNCYSGSYGYSLINIYDSEKREP